MGKKIISFSLYGDIPSYNIGAINNAKIAKILYKDWECWFYVDELTVPSYTIDELNKLSNVTIFLKKSDILSSKMSWRFEAIDDKDVSIVITRDTDTIMYKREVLAVNEWIKSNKVLHIMKDSPCHRYLSLQGGMFGMNKLKPFPNIKETSLEYFTNNPNGNDISYIEDILFPLFINNIFVHDEFTPLYNTIDNGKYYKPDLFTYNKFPIRYNPEYNFIGEYIYADGSRNLETCQILKDCLDINPHMIQKYKKIKLAILFTSLDNSHLYDKYKLFYNNINIHTTLIIFPQNIKYTYFTLYALIFTLSKYSTLDLNGGIISHIINDELNNNHIIEFNNQTNEEMIIYNKMITYYGDIEYINNKLNLDKNIYNIFDTFDYSSFTNMLIQAIHPIITNIKLDRFDKYNIKDIYIIHYTKLTERKKYMLNQISEHNLDKYFNINWIDNFDREIITQSQINKYYKFINDEIYILTADVTNNCTSINARPINLSNPDDLKSIKTKLFFGRQIFQQILQCSDLHISGVYNAKFDDYSRYLTDGEIANAIAHINVIEQIALSNTIGLIIEDDIILRSNFIDSLEYVLQSVPSDWDILTIGGWYDSNLYQTNYNLNPSDKIKIIKSPFKETTISCYILKSETAKYLVENTNFNIFSTPFDHHLTQCVKDLNIYWVDPWIGVEGSKSNPNKNIEIYTSSFVDRGF